MTNIKLSNAEAKVLQALRAGPMESTELSDRFPGGYPMQKLIKQGFVATGKFGYQLTEAGRAACPTRRSFEKAEHMPKPAITVAKPSTNKPVQTIDLNAVKLPSIKQPEAIMRTQNTAQLIRETIKAYPGIEHDALIAKITSNAVDAVEIKKAADMITYVIKTGGFSKCADYKVGTLKKVKIYFTNEDYLKRKQKAQAQISNNIPTLAQHHKAQMPELKKAQPMKNNAAQEPIPQPPVISITFAIQLPDMPDQLKLVGLKKSNLDDAIASGDSYTVDVATLDDNAVDALCAQWAAKFKAHVQARKNSN